ncbi:SMP-30/gluconolactonase/LRE family protein [Paenibacillus sp. IB182496]|uniref:SMP-30/gluconolactonase/LRE family protein n=1 Tax=Paenibacillus sabuli TaxID=2772509 RepID=A0A927BQW3_9BACL|nr:SMP-30/gluconolactonase/LRE family protein [Paenibacillus sabuli]MBD2844100.1 SMP-30/gluconolactonase/LRE family protein [Paenibacillus sabuli]
MELKRMTSITAQLGEGPAWDEPSKRLYWVDITGFRYHVYDPVGEGIETVQVGSHLGTLALREKGGVVLALQDGIYCRAEDEEGGVEPIWRLPDQDAGIRFNDGKCDPAGRFWAGTMAMDGRRGAGSLYRLDTDGSVHQMLDGVTTSNGLAWSLDGQTMYYIDSGEPVVWALDYERASGAISNRRAAITFAPEDGTPDGMTIDEQGMLWIAFWGGSKVARWDAEAGRCLQEIALPCPQVTSCVFGGAARDVLYITTAREGMDADALERYPQAGALFAVRPGVCGVPTYRYRG